jgi:hypothetical protein
MQCRSRQARWRQFAVCIADGPTAGESEQFVADVRLHTPGTSVGTASQRGASADIASLYATADADLYKAKRKKLPDTPDADLRPAL